MAVIVQYNVEQNGAQKRTFDNKKDAELYDKQLQISANMSKLLDSAGVSIAEEPMEKICFFLAEKKDEAMAVLKGAKPVTKASNKSAKKSKPKAKKSDNPETTAKSDQKPKGKNRILEEMDFGAGGS
jgi:dsDNA-binding SOS-regulon protein